MNQTKISKKSLKKKCKRTIAREAENKRTTTELHQEFVKKPSSTITIRNLPHLYSYAKISLIFRDKRSIELEVNEFEFLLASSIQSLHGEIANQADILSFNSIDNQNYSAILKFKAIHCTRVITSLILFSKWKGKDCKFEIKKIAQTPFFLSLS